MSHEWGIKDERNGIFMNFTLHAEPRWIHDTSYTVCPSMSVVTHHKTVP